MDLSTLVRGDPLSIPLPTLLGYVQSLSDSIVIIDAEQRLLYMNDHAKLEVARYVASLGDHFLADVMEDAKAVELTRLCSAAIEAGSPLSLETRLDWLDAWYEIQATPCDGNLILRFRNISDRRQAEEQLRTAEERYRLAAMATKDLIWDWDLVSKELEWSAALHQFGYGSASLKSPIEWWKQRIHPVDRTRVVESIEQILETGGDYWKSKYRLMRADGSYVVVGDRGYVIRNGEGEPIRMVGAITDLTDDKDARQELARTRTLSQSVATAAQIRVHVIDPDGTVVYEHEFGSINRHELQPTDSVGKSWFDQFAGASEEAARAIVAKVFAEQREERIELRTVAEQGAERWLELTLTPVIVGEQSPRLMISALDVTSIQQLRQSLRETQLVHQSILEASADCIMILGTDGTIKLINEPGLRMLEIVNPATFSNRPWTELWPDRVHETVRAALQDANANRVARFTDSAPTQTGILKWWDVVVTPMVDDAGQVIRLLAIARDITGARAQAEKVQWASEHDALTALPNRRAFQSRLQSATLKATGDGTTVGLLLIDLDHFKHVNDALGHAAGDCLLTSFGQRLRACVAKRGSVARVGGDEFAVVVEELDGPDELAYVAETILDSMQIPFTYEDRVIAAGASIGGALFPADAGTGHELFKSADIALYALKQAGRGGMKMFHSHLREQAQLVASQLSLARMVVREESLVPFYQPKVELKSGKIIGFEALLRWEHATQGIQLPEMIAAGFHEYDLASRLGELMYTRVFRDLVRWRDQNIEVGRVSINAAPAEFLRDNYSERLLKRMEEMGVPPSCVEVEVTEHVFLDRGTQHVIRALHALKAAGVQIALDDFGTGYSSLSHLRDLPVDVVKIDRSFISRVPEEKEIGSIVTAVVDLARSLSLQVVAEGIETELQRSFLVLRRCDHGQGYLFGRPMPAGAVAGALEQNSGPRGAGTRMVAR